MLSARKAHRMPVFMVVYCLQDFSITSSARVLFQVVMCALSKVFAGFSVSATNIFFIHLNRTSKMDVHALANSQTACTTLKAGSKAFAPFQGACNARSRKNRGQPSLALALMPMRPEQHTPPDRCKLPCKLQGSRLLTTYPHCSWNMPCNVCGRDCSPAQQEGHYPLHTVSCHSPECHTLKSRYNSSTIGHFWRTVQNMGITRPEGHSEALLEAPQDRYAHT